MPLVAAAAAAATAAAAAAAAAAADDDDDGDDDDDATYECVGVSNYPWPMASGGLTKDGAALPRL